MDAVKWALAAVVLVATVPILTVCMQLLVAMLHVFGRDARRGGSGDTRRIAIVLPAWNEGAVVGRTLDTLMRLDHPAELLRVYVVDDGSTDDTPDVVRAKADEHPGRIFHLRRDQGGQGKAHTLNHGLRRIREEGWFDAVLIMDADVIFTPRSVRRMARHLDDPEIGAVTGYIKEGSRPANMMNRFIGYEYANAQAVARRGQNRLGAQACLAGGAQLVRRDALEAIGGEIDTGTLAEDTVTTLNIQLSGLRVVFEPHAIVWAEEPRDITGLWKQRMRWARGNIQVTFRFRDMWLRRSKGPTGTVTFALIWFSVLLIPAFMIASSAALIALLLIDREFSVEAFRVLWVVNVVAYVFITLSTLSVDPEVARRSWREGILFPGLVNLAIIVYACYPPLVDDHVASRLGASEDDAWHWAVLLFTYVWLSASLLAAWLVKCADGVAGLRRLTPALLLVVGYGPLLCSILAGAYIKELRGAEMVWEKTEKTGAIGDVA